MMRRHIYADQLDQNPTLGETTLRHRADQFKFRLRRGVTVDENSCKKDQYDDLNPLFVIREIPDGRHGGFLRFLPTTGRTMVNEHFSEILGGCTIISPYILGIHTLLSQPQRAEPRGHSADAGGGEIMQKFHIQHFASVFDARMVRIFRMIGSSPNVLGSQGACREPTSVDLWKHTPAPQPYAANRAGELPELPRVWYERDLKATIAYDFAAVDQI